MELMGLDQVNVQALAWLIVALNAIFAVAWGLDARVHGELEKTDITDRELHVHRLILVPSLLMEGALVAMALDRWLALPFFLAFYLVRTIHEAIDELRYHVDRCSRWESYLHLVMWCTVHAKTWLMFLWAFALGFRGILELPIALYMLWLGVLGVLGVIALVEFRRGGELPAP